MTLSEQHNDLTAFHLFLGNVCIFIYLESQNTKCLLIIDGTHNHCGIILQMHYYNQKTSESNAMVDGNCKSNTISLLVKDH